VFDDATPIQMGGAAGGDDGAGKKDRSEVAGWALYACQIASTNLRQMENEKPRPVQVWWIRRTWRRRRLIS